MKRRGEWGCFFALLLASALVLLLFAGASPLYPTNPWVDANCFHTVARGMANGMVPYRDLMEQKGPLLYLLHVPAVWISPHGFFGVYLLEVLAMALFLFASWRTVSLFIRKSWWPLLIAVAVLLVGSRAFVWGDSAEELCAPMLAWSLFEALRYFSDPERRMTNVCLLRNGLLAGCLFWIKFSLLGFHFAWMAAVAIECVVRRRGVGRAARMCLVFLLGMALPAVPWLIYFAVNGALGDLWQVYFVQNIFGYGRDGSRILNVCVGLFGGSVVNPLVGLPALGGVLYLLVERREGRKLSRKLFLALAMGCAALATYSGGRLNGYYYYIFACFVPLGCIPLARAAERLGARRGRRLAVGAAVCLCALSALFSDNLPRLGYPREALAQTRAAEIIAETDGATLLNFGFLDGGFYLAADVMPENRWFCQLLANREDCFDEQSGIVARGEVDYVITRDVRLEDYPLDASAYALVGEWEEAFNYKDLGKIYYLYRRLEA